MPMPVGAPGPDVTIIIPVFNKLELTRACIESIHQVGAAATFEIVVVDNGSSDGSADWLADQQAQGRLRLVSHPENMGFARGCNLGADHARGRYLLFLNNDMEVLEGWLDPLVSTLDRDPEAGIVGAKLLFADNTIQHAGVALVENPQQENCLGGVHLNSGKPGHFNGSAHPMYFQAVTGACLLTRAHLFFEIGGFDEVFYNGNEDVDLCLKAGQKGWKVVYRPESVIYHYESQSGPERWAQTRANVEKFNTIWKGVARPDFIQQHDGGIKARDDLSIRNYVSPRLAWHDNNSRTPADPSVSVIVLTWNALEYTRRCAESLLAHTDARHELLFVDNGSRPDTLAYLELLEKENPQVRVISNGCNLGFAGGNNVGMAAARGDHVCLLNSDTVVTPGWLDALLAPALENEKVGLVGPVTNSISGGQKLPVVDYDQDNLAGLEKFAAQRSGQYAGQSQRALMVVGFCLLIRRELMARIGGLDEGFGQGNYEDTDYCLRALLAGYHAEVALDCFVHHFGSRSFADARIDYARQIDEKFQIFRRKWNLEATARSAANLDLQQLLQLGFIPPLHFHPLPEAPGHETFPLESWEQERWLGLGEAFFKNSRLEEAERIFRAVLSFAPENLRGANDLACTLSQKKEPAASSEAVALLEQILAKDPGNEDARWNLKELSATVN